jgi:hypothetical protein
VRQILSTALVAVIVGALAGVTAGTFAQAEPGSAVEPAAKTRNADRVDGKHAVAYTNKRGVRAGKLVATNARGLLPSNIVQPYWGYIKNKPGILADHQIAWNEVANKPGVLADGQVGWFEVHGKPPGFADNVDNAGVTGVTITRVATPEKVVPAGGTETDIAYCPPGSRVVGGGVNGFGVAIEDSYPHNDTDWFGRGTDLSGGGGSIYVFALCMSVEPGIVAAARNANIAAASSE